MFIFALAWIGAITDGASQSSPSYGDHYHLFYENQVLNEYETRLSDYCKTREQEAEQAKAARAVRAANSTPRHAESASATPEFRDLNYQLGWIYSQLPDTFPGNASASIPGSLQSSTAERLSAAINTSVPGTPTVEAGISLRPFGLAELSGQRDMRVKYAALLDAETKLKAAEASLASARESVTARIAELALAQARLASAHAESGLRADNAREAQGQAGVDVEVAEAALRRAQRREKAERVIFDQAQADVKSKRTASSTPSRGEETGSVWSNTLVKSLTLRAGGLAGLGFRAGTGVRVFEANSKPPVVTGQDIKAAGLDAVVSKCREFEEKDVKETWRAELRDAVREGKKRYIFACKALAGKIDATYATADAEFKEDLTNRIIYSDACTQKGVYSASGTARLGLITQLATAVGCKEKPDCYGLEDFDSSLADASTFAELEKRALLNKTPTLLEDAAWSTRSIWGSIDAFGDFDPLVRGFAPKNAEGDRIRRGDGSWRQFAGVVTLAGQRRGGLYSGSGGLSAIREQKDNELQPAELGYTFEFRFACTFASLDPSVRLRRAKNDKSESRSVHEHPENRVQPYLACARNRDVNPKAIDSKTYKVSVPHAAFFLQASVAGALRRRRPDESTSLREASATIGIDFIVSDTLKFRVGVPVKASVVKQEASAQPTPGRVIPAASSLQISIPVFATTVLAI